MNIPSISALCSKCKANHTYLNWRFELLTTDTIPDLDLWENMGITLHNGQACCLDYQTKSQMSSPVKY